MSGRKGSLLKATIASGKPVFGTFIGLNDPVMTRIFAQLGFDFLVVDTEHNAFDQATLQQVLLAFEGTDTCPIVRVPWHEQVWTKWALDYGAEGILFPNIKSAEEARQAVADCKYPPQGTRGFFPRAASNFMMNIDSYMDGINERIVVWTQVEHIDTVNCLDEITAVPGIDALFIGPADLSMSMGLFNRYDDPAFQAAIQRVFAGGRKAGLPVAYHMFDPSPQFVKKIAGGVQIFSYAYDWIFAQQGALAYLKDIRKILETLQGNAA